MLALSSRDGELSASLPLKEWDPSLTWDAQPRSWQQLTEWLETSPDAVACVDQGGTIRVANQAFRRLFEPGELTACPSLKHFVPLLGATQLQQLAAESDDSHGILRHHPLVLEGRIAGQRRALLCVNVQRLGQPGEPREATGCVVALRTVHPAAPLEPPIDLGPQRHGCTTTLPDLLEAALTGLPAGQRRRFEVALDAPPALLPLEMEPVRDALHMLLSSASTRAPKASRIRVLARLDNADDGRWAVITIADRGSGLRRRDLQRVFEPMSGTKTAMQTGGRGPALRLARRIIEGQGGWVEVRSALGIGTEVDIWLPLVPTPDPSP